MDRQAFRNRMQQLKQYREQNPGKTYLDWKNSLPSNLQDESNYNLRRAYELGYEPEWNEDDKSYTYLLEIVKLEKYLRSHGILHF